MKIYSLKSCDTCKKSIRALNEAGFEPDVIDVRAQGVAREDLQQFYDSFGDKLVNTRSTTWRNMSEDARSADPIEMLIAHPTLMKRPVIDHNGTLYLGWGKDTQSALL